MFVVIDINKKGQQMSKESYARGFCKAAAAAGVDPVALAKYAQQYKTEGYVPSMQKLEGSGSRIEIPFLSSLMGRIYKDTPPLLEVLGTGGRVNEGILDDDLKARMALNPKFKNWVDAHTNAAQKALAPLINIGYPRDKDIPQDIGGMLSKLYHDEMKRTTSAPPVQVSAPAKK